MATELKDFRYDFPLEKIGEKKRRAAKVTLSDAGFFIIVYPKEVVAVFPSADHAYGSTLRDAESMFLRQIERYKNAIQTEKREKVILVQFLYNLPGNSPLESRRQLQRADHGHWRDHAGEYGMTVKYEVMYRINGHLYDVPIDDDGSIYGAPHHRFTLPINDHAYSVLDWTEDREQFLSRMCYGLEDFIGKMRTFFGSNLLDHMTLAIEKGGNFMAALPAPERV